MMENGVRSNENIKPVERKRGNVFLSQQEKKKKRDWGRGIGYLKKPCQLKHIREKKGGKNMEKRNEEYCHCPFIIYEQAQKSGKRCVRRRKA